MMLTRWMAAAMVLLVSGCAGSGVDPDTTEASPGQTVDIADLDVGNYVSTPRPPLGQAETFTVGAAIEARRMSGFVVGPWEIDAELWEAPLGLLARVYPAPSVYALNVGKQEGAALTERDDFVNGFRSERASPRSADARRDLANTVLRLGDPTAAAETAPALAQGLRADLSSTSSVAESPPQPIAIPGHPEALAVSYSHVVKVDGQRRHAAVSYTAHGPYVLKQYAETTGDPAELPALIAGTLDVQVPRIDQFTPTDPYGFKQLPLDPSGLLARTVPLPEDDDQFYPEQNAVYDRAAILHFLDDPLSAERALTDAGTVTLVGRVEGFGG